MKTNSPIKRHQALVSFSKDHHFGLLLVWKIKQGLSNAVAPERISNYIFYCFAEDLQHHFKEEEQLIFCKLSADDILRQHAEKDHQIIYGLIEQIRSDKNNEALLTQFADKLQEHIRFEERILFNHLQKELTVSAMQIISTYTGSQAGDIDCRWQDIFWGIKNAGLQK